MIRSKKSLRAIAALAGVAALTLSACGTTGGNDNDKKSSSSGPACNVEIDFFGAQTGGAAALGVNASNGDELAIEQYNAKHPDCKVAFNKIDSQSDPKQAPNLAKT